ncbi:MULTISPECIES: efflux RND transporter periplasmic adaptor subunit [Roseivirga]|uniref:efflux RND transporter periplasmic adaptor subunit n=1 Tax=Roseivirga TaxID=290180 RepID=UPI001B13DC75|nr:MULTISPECIES: efflux RND transporter periplasmic adaptor subunit [Roseivirga]MBO6659139.1 efflux RND transporter periplasmic adaptor subunit [Roseivirga sp.]MBO6759669.1 efflux RND transporter periplasmic adaptor subunit [Roseivirga sp.]MBO6908124.1 efflux RND transporter periplasmic adaptor subunit [Roseivirga sp.]WPZ10463.1 efflux RND transporter periplasmic adaptor subunit [Roseivirga spongicola]
MDRKIKKKTWTTKRIVTILGSGGILFLILYVFVFADNASKLNVDLEKISVGDVVEGPFQEYIPLEGTVQPKTTIFLDSKVSGNVEDKFLEGGVQVKKGDTILKLENRALEMSYIQEQTQTNRLRNDIENTNNRLQQQLFTSRAQVINIDFDIDEAKDQFTRNEQLWKDKVISEQDYLNSKRRYNRLKASRENIVKQMEFDSINAVSQVTQNEQRLITSEESLKIVQGQLQDLWVTAPIDGLLSTVNAEIGQSIGQGTTIAQIDDLDGFKIAANVDQHYLPRVYEGLVGTYDFAGQEYRLEIRKKFPEINNGTFVVEMVGEIPEGVRRGQTLSIRLQLSEEKNAIQIPRGSFFQTTGGNWIFVLNEDQTEATRRNIRIGNQTPRNYEVLEGLQPGEKVIFSSYEGYDDKDKLVIKK